MKYKKYLSLFAFSTALGLSSAAETQATPAFFNEVGPRATVLIRPLLLSSRPLMGQYRPIHQFTSSYLAQNTRPIFHASKVYLHSASSAVSPHKLRAVDLNEVSEAIGIICNKDDNEIKPEALQAYKHIFDALTKVASTKSKGEPKNIAVDVRSLLDSAITPINYNGIPDLITILQNIGRNRASSVKLVTSIQPTITWPENFGLIAKTLSSIENPKERADCAEMIRSLDRLTGVPSQDEIDIVIAAQILASMAIEQRSKVYSEIVLNIHNKKPSDILKELKQKKTHENEEAIKVKRIVDKRRGLIADQ